MKKVAYVAALASVANAKTYFSENFDDASWEDRWVTTEVRTALVTRRKHSSNSLKKKKTKTGMEDQ